MATPSDPLLQAIHAAESRYSVLDWHQIAPRVRTAAIYEELRRLDAERVHVVPVARWRRRASGKAAAYPGQQA